MNYINNCNNDNNNNNNSLYTIIGLALNRSYAVRRQRQGYSYLGS